MAFGEAPASPDYMSPPDEGGDMAAEATEYSSDEEAALAEAFPEMGQSPDRLAAFKTAVSLCVERILAERDGGDAAPTADPFASKADKPKGGKAKAADALILAFGKPKSGAKD